jgi:hypothetical protein
VADPFPDPKAPAGRDTWEGTVRHPACQIAASDSLSECCGCELQLILGRLAELLVAIDAVL